MNMNYGSSCSEMEDWRSGGLFALRDPSAQCFGVFVYFKNFWQDFTMIEALPRAELRGYRLTFPLSGTHIYLVISSCCPFPQCSTAGKLWWCRWGCTGTSHRCSPLRETHTEYKAAGRYSKDTFFFFLQTEKSLTTLNPLMMLKDPPPSNKSLGSQAGTISCN